MGNEIVDESVYLRVTTPLSRFSGLENVPAPILNYAADRGERVHEYCDLYANSMMFAGDIDQDCVEYVQAFINWFDDEVEDVICTEKRLFCDTWKIQGKPDLVCKLKNSPFSFGYTLVDIKTSSKKSKTWDLQTAAYKYLCIENNIPVQERFVIHLHKDGTFTRLPYLDYEKNGNYISADGAKKTEDQYLDHLNTYGACLQAHRFFS